MQWEKKCQSFGNEDASFEGSCGQLSGTSNDIHTKLAFETMDRIKKVPAHHINSYKSNDVMPLQYNTNEYQISLSEIPGVIHNGSYLNMDDSQFPLCDESGNGFGEHSIPCRSKDYSGNGNYCTQEVGFSHSNIDILIIWLWCIYMTLPVSFIMRILWLRILVIG
jgi:hypothetical protein